MQPLSGNQLPDLRTYLLELEMSLVLRVPREMHLCIISSSNAPRLPSFFRTATKPSRLAPFWRGAESTAPATKNDAWTFKSGRNMWCFYHVDFKMGFAPQPRTLFNSSTSKSAPGLMCFSHFDFETRFALPKAFPRMKCLAFQLNVLRATTACAFPTSQLPKVLRTRCVFNILTSTCVSCHGRLHFLISSNQMPPHPLL